MISSEASSPPCLSSVIQFLDRFMSEHQLWVLKMGEVTFCSVLLSMLNQTYLGGKNRWGISETGKYNMKKFVDDVN